MKKYLISGIGPGEAGAARLVSHLKGLAEENGWNVIYPYKHVSLNRLYKQKSYLQLCIEIIKRFFMRLVFIIRILLIRNSKILLLHPQTLGYKYFIRLILKNTHIYQYVLDNSFFCIKSYNYKDKHECLQCVNDLDACDKSCQAFPVKYRKKNNLDLLKKYKELSTKITFLAQSVSQEKLLRLHFGMKSNIKIVGMYTGEIIDCKYIDNSSDYIVYHGSEHESKGIMYFLELAEKLPEFKFIIPHEKNRVYPNLDNVKYQPCSWETGLKYLVENARMVINPSLWSAPIEGALLKSMALNKHVVAVKTKYGFVNEIPDEVLFKVSEEQLEDDIIKIRNFLSQKLNDTSKVENWLKEYLNSSNRSLIDFFSSIS
ncbi:MAG: hypothetical protein COB67_07440 [SAR324 cluster bacterium]|uniref:Glycosyl transferase family 1 domain-containing protein n=1 Tax=SAR324 cluster bacterium TaxID=2024889 RepID=A0A2A4T3W3_9DELT|nr:MAG: hypothetical protein COB67_07440 [SAR324 cluster bacterium]